MEVSSVAVTQTYAPPPSTASGKYDTDDKGQVAARKYSFPSDMTIEVDPGWKAVELDAKPGNTNIAVMETKVSPVRKVGDVYIGRDSGRVGGVGDDDDGGDVRVNVEETSETLPDGSIVRKRLVQTSRRQTNEMTTSDVHCNKVGEHDCVA